MISIISFIGCCILSFLYKILNVILVKFKENVFIKKYYTYVWSTLILIIALIYSNSLIRQTSFEYFQDRQIMGKILKFALSACILGCLSGYKTFNPRYDFDFCIIFPIFEEILFRGVILIILLKLGAFSENHAVILSALLFSVMHFQYFGFNKGVIRYVIFAFVGGYFFAYLALETQSILPTIFLHIVFNTSAIIFSKNKKRLNVDKNAN